LITYSIRLCSDCCNWRFNALPYCKSTVL